MRENPRRILSFRNCPPMQSDAVLCLAKSFSNSQFFAWYCKASTLLATVKCNSRCTNPREGNGLDSLRCSLLPPAAEQVALQLRRVDLRRRARAKECLLALESPAAMRRVFPDRRIQVMQMNTRSKRGIFKELKRFVSRLYVQVVSADSNGLLHPS